MIGWQKIYAIISGIIYLTLFVVFIFYSTSDIAWICSEDNPCLRFCSNDTKTFPTHELFSKVGNFGIVNFYDFGYEEDENATVGELKYHSFWGDNENIIFTIFRGDPECKLNVVKNPERPKYDYDKVW